MPVYVNGRALGNGQESPIDPGDEIRIGGFTLVVKPGARAPASAVESPAARPEPAPAGESKDDPLQMLGGRGGSRGAGVFDDLIAPTPRSRPAPTARPDAPFEDKRAVDAKPGAGMAIPPDYDIFETPAAPAALEPSGPVIPDDFDLLRGTLSGAPSIDKLFDLQPGARADPFAPDHPLGAGSPAAKAPAAQRDDAPEIRGSFRLPEAKPDPAAAQARQQVPAETSTSNMIVSWEGAESPGKVKTVVIPSRTAPSQSEPRAVDPFGNEWTDPPLAAPRAATPPPGERSAPLRSGPNDQELLRAFLAGAGVPELQLPGLSPKLLEIFGQLLREATKGTLDLLAARAITKREMRADMTMIVASENNPLKFSPNVEAAMSHLLAPQGRGFMTPLRAMRDAYDDLRAHQFAFVAGMRAALTGVLARFDPETLERRLTEKSVIDSVLPMNRKAKLWDLFEQLHSDLQREAEDDFDALFGREFLRAYEAQLAKLEQAGKDRSG